VLLVAYTPYSVGLHHINSQYSSEWHTWMTTVAESRCSLAILFWNFTSFCYTSASVIRVFRWLTSSYIMLVCIKCNSRLWSQRFRGVCHHLFVDFPRHAIIERFPCGQRDFGKKFQVARVTNWPEILHTCRGWQFVISDPTYVLSIFPFQKWAPF